MGQNREGEIPSRHIGNPQNPNKHGASPHLCGFGFSSRTLVFLPNTFFQVGVQNVQQARQQAFFFFK